MDKKNIIKEKMVQKWNQYKYDLSDNDMKILEDIEDLVKEYENKFGPVKMLRGETQQIANEGKHYI